MKTIRLIDLIDEIKGTKNVSKQKVERVVRAIPKVISAILLEKKEVKFTPFFKLSFRVAKDRMVKSPITKEMLHMPQHLRFKGSFYEDFKKFLNK